MLERQVEYILIQEECPKYKLSYFADFTYYEKVLIKKKGTLPSVIWRMVVEDVKGMETQIYKRNRRLMLEKYGIKIRETR